MKISETRAEGLLREYSILITAAEIDEQVSAKLAELATTVNMPGFRPGKVPMSVVKSRFGPQVQGEALKNALDEGARKAIEDNELRLASQPSVDIKAYDEGKDLEAALSCEIMPEISMPDLAALKIEKPMLEAGKAEVDEALNNIADANRPTVEVSGKRAAKTAMSLLSISSVVSMARLSKAVLQKVIRWSWGQPASFPALKKALSGSNPARHAM
jgi:trigger factor